MGTETTEQGLRCEAIRRRLKGERRCDICQDLQRSLRWFSKWWAEYQQNPHSDFSAHSRAPHTVPAKTPEPVARAICSIRQTLEVAATRETAMA